MASVHFDSWYLYSTVHSLTMLNLPLVIKMYTVLQPPAGLGNPEVFSFLYLLKPNYGGWGLVEMICLSQRIYILEKLLHFSHGFTV